MFVQESTLTGCESRVAASPRAAFVAIPAWKRILDTLLILLFLPAWLPLMLIIALGIRLASKGPVIFRQERVGYRGQRFLCLKFRSMHCNATVEVHKEHLQHLMSSGTPMLKLDNGRDPRVIPFGGILRASGLDELPQIFNVLRGEMSLVGPRPCTPYEYEAYQPRHKERFAVLPGLTGLWQVSGKNNTTFEEMILLDVRYGKELSLKRDLWILLKTVGVLCGQVLESIKPRMNPTDARHTDELTTNENHR
jgi:lipopolysaccharide/colanic/teichoic acid biosynthesis glycosyltransferase